MEDLAAQVFELRREVAQLKSHIWHSQQDNSWWQGWRNDVGWLREQENAIMSSGCLCRALLISSHLTSVSEYASKPVFYGNNFEVYESSCPCCRRPLNLTVSE